jgi:hypothetical protein
MNPIFTNKKMGNANPKKANIQKLSGDIYLEATENNKLIIKM